MGKFEENRKMKKYICRGGGYPPHITQNWRDTVFTYYLNS